MLSDGLVERFTFCSWPNNQLSIFIFLYPYSDSNLRNQTVIIGENGISEQCSLLSSAVDDDEEEEEDDTGEAREFGKKGKEEIELDVIIRSKS